MEIVAIFLILAITVAAATWHVWVPPLLVRLRGAPSFAQEPLPELAQEPLDEATLKIIMVSFVRQRLALPGESYPDAAVDPEVLRRAGDLPEPAWNGKQAELIQWAGRLAKDMNEESAAEFRARRAALFSWMVW